MDIFLTSLLMEKNVPMMEKNVPMPGEVKYAASIQCASHCWYPIIGRGFENAID